MAAAVRVLACCLLLLGVARAQFYPFCTSGIAKADFAAGSPVEVILAQAPLFSSNPSVGNKLGYLHMYHSTIIFAQGAGTSRHYWTMEFDFTGGGVTSSIVPNITEDASMPGGVSLTWNNDARFCLTDGLLWGRAHWSKRFDVITSITVDEAKQAFTNFVGVANRTTHNKQSQYQLWRVAKIGWSGNIEKTFVPDITCNNGAVWFLHYLHTEIKAAFPTDFIFKGTATVLKADSVQKVDTSDAAEVKKMMHYFAVLANLVGAKSSIFERLKAFTEWAPPHKYVYDSNSQEYYQLFGNGLPWIEFKYTEFPLAGPPWMTPSKPASKAASANLLVV